MGQRLGLRWGRDKGEKEKQRRDKNKWGKGGETNWRQCQKVTKILCMQAETDIQKQRYFEKPREREEGED